jgi:membrane protein DedA with SNARE-associated domain
MSDAAQPPLERPRLPTFSGVDLLCATGLALGVVASYVFLALSPSLLEHHGVLLEALNGSNAAIVGGGAFARIGRDSLLLVVLAPLCTIALYDVFYWWAGRLWGDKIAEFYVRSNPRAARWIARSERMVRRRGIWALAIAYYLPFPNVVVYASCGVSGMPFLTFLLGDVIGTLLWEALLVGLGWWIGHPAVRVIKEVSHYSLLVTIGLVVVVVAVSVARQRGRSTTTTTPAEPREK